ncbi:hypothetical protein AB1K62_14365 [Parasphingorhabdus sp. JC815]|uniref:hypothetical protein n=1 Tax=Parasphingorhabdus sp. JC815 TaxID=3232140 RepID=UPI003458E1F5
MSNKKFIADVKAFTDKTAGQMLRVAKQSLQDTIRTAQTPVAQGGDMPVDTGYLRNSLVTTVRGAKAGDGADSFILGLSTLELGDPFQVAWTADYAIPRHYMVGVGQGGGLWRDKAAQRWSGFVAKNASKVQ